jgi:hypothetical protein
MAKKAEKTFNSFVKGLVTEASELTFPEGALVDGENFVLKRDGSLERRLGIDYENLYTKVSTGLSEAQIEEGRSAFYRWNSPSGDSSLNIGVIRIYNRFWFVDLLTSNPSTNLLNNETYIEVPGLTISDVQFANLNNQLIIVSQDLSKPVVFTYNTDNKKITTSDLNLKIRDLFGVNDGYEAHVRPDYAGIATMKEWIASSADFSIGDEVFYGSNVYKVKGTTVGQNTTRPTVGIYSNIGVPYPGGGSAATAIMGTTPPSHITGTIANGTFTLEYIRAITATDTSEEHRYNLRNQGWSKTIEVKGGGDAIDKTGSVLGVFPSNADVYSLGKNSNPSNADYEKYDPDILKKNSQSRYQVARGSFIIDAFNRGQSRLDVVDDAKIIDLPTDKENGRLTTVAAYAQRLFYSGVKSDITDPDSRSPNYNNYIFFTRVVRSPEDFEKCYQEADPTDPGINDLVASDGGTIQIPEISRIVKIVAAQSSLLVFCQNGVWEVYGDTGGFYANNFQVSKISTNGVLDQNSIVQVGGNFLYWSNSGIYALTTDSASGRFAPENISLKTIQKFYLDIPFLGKKHARGFYDEKENRVRFLYNDSAEYSETNYVNKYNKELVYDLTLQAFSVFTIGELTSANAPYVTDYIEIPNFISSEEATNVLVGTDTVETSTDVVIVNVDIEADRDSQYAYLTLQGTNWTISKYKDTTFTDWKTEDATGVDFTSYLITGYEYFGDLLKRKQVPYVQFYFERTEDGYSISGNELTLNNPSSALVQAQWNWSDSINSGKWGREFQAYKLLRHYIPENASDSFDYGDKIIITKNKLRGSGKTLSLYIRSEEGKDMKLQGWVMPVTLSDTV